MGVDEVHRILVDVFPQVDNRVLRAVAFAHANDADLAVEAVIIEVIPYLSENIMKSSSPNASESPSEAVDATVTDGPNTTFLLESVQDSLKSTEKGESRRIMSSNSASSGESEDEEPTSLRKGKSKARSDKNLLSHSLEHGKVLLSDSKDSDESLPSVNGTICAEILPRVGKSKSISDELSLSCSLDTIEVCASASASASASALLPELVDSDNSLMPLFENGVPSETNSAVQKSMELAIENSSQLLAGPDTQVTVLEEQEASTILTSCNNDLWTSELVDLQDESTMNTMVSRSGYVCSIDFLEDLVEEARNNKKNLVSAMDSVISLAREVELQEKEAEEAKMEATSGCEAIQNKVQELKLALQRAKEANDMHAGEVYAEKAVLTTEAKELQSRLLSLSEERDRSLRILAEMRESLEVRLNAAQKEIEEALQAKLEKEASAREALALQERIMDDVVQESKLLKQEAEANSKLQDFLMDRGRLVDMLQGEISVKCQDVTLLKEKFDNRVPLSTSLFSTQTTLGSSSCSSSRSTSPPLRLDWQADSYNKLQKSEVFVDSFDTLQSKTDLDSYQALEQGAQVSDSSEAMKSSVMTTPNDHLSDGEEEEKASDDSKVFVDDGWDLL